MERRGPAGSYWVVPGRLLAGMYPDAETIPELRAAGVDTFFDLTEDAELDRVRPGRPRAPPLPHPRHEHADARS